jgi:RND family efflux transporter MFP subunit
VSSDTTQNNISLTGEIRAENEAGVGFRVNGKMIERLVSLGDVVKPGQILARLDPQDMASKLVAAKADLAAAQAELTEAKSDEERQRKLYNQGVAPQMRFEAAERTLGVARAKVEAAKAQAKLAQDQLGYTQLVSDVDGAVTETLAEAGEVVQAGQVVIRVANDDGRDAIFDVPETLMQGHTKDGGDLTITVALTANPKIQAEGQIREVSPQADPVTRTFRVKVGLIDPPAEFRLGSVVTGQAVFDKTSSIIQIPAMALNREEAQPAVWVVDPKTTQVSLRKISVGHYEHDSVIVTGGLNPGDIVVTAGEQTLHPGQDVRLGTSAPQAVEPATGASQ